MSQLWDFDFDTKEPGKFSTAWSRDRIRRRCIFFRFKQFFEVYYKKKKIIKLKQWILWVNTFCHKNHLFDLISDGLLNWFINWNKNYFLMLEMFKYFRLLLLSVYLNSELKQFQKKKLFTSACAIIWNLIKNLKQIR